MSIGKGYLSMVDDWMSIGNSWMSTGKGCISKVESWMGMARIKKQWTFPVVLWVSLLLLLAGSGMQAVPVQAEDHTGETVIIDHGGAGYSESGVWTESTTVRGYNNSSTRYGNTSQGYAQWKPDVAGGTYRVSVFKPVHANNDKQAVVTVYHQFGSSPHSLDYTAGSSGWVELGLYSFAPGDSGYVRVTSADRGLMRADAVMFEQVDADPVALASPPENEALALDTRFKIHFSKNMPLEQLVPEMIVLHNDTAQSSVPAAIGILDTGRAVEITPANQLMYGTAYTLRLDEAMTDTEGKLLSGAISWSFITVAEDTTPPAASVVFPASAGHLTVSSSIEIAFTKPVDPQTVHPGAELVVTDVAAGLPVAYELAWKDDHTRLILTPAAHLSYSAAYTLTLGSGIKDMGGRGLAPFAPWTFTTAPVSNPLPRLYVSPGGSDSNPGTAEAPVATVSRAQDLVRAMNSNMAGDITVYLGGGTYALSDTLLWTGQDSGTNGYYIRYTNKDGEIPVLSGGRAITGWSAVEGSGIWSAPAGSVPFRQLYVNGSRAVRARSETLYSAISYNADRSGFIVDGEVLGQWDGADQLELSWYKGWRHSRAVVDRIIPGADPGTYEVIMKQPYFNWMTTSGYLAHGPNLYGFQLENAKELLDRPGEWYLDSGTQTVYYWPLPGENPAASEIIAPQVQTLASLQGTLDEPVQYLEFSGISFRHGTWMQPSEQGISTIQGDVVASGLNQKGGLNQGEKITGNILLHAAQHIRFERNRFEHMGAAGIVLEYGTSDVSLTGNIFTDISAAAIIAGDLADAYPADSRQVTRRNTIDNNVIYNAANEYWGSTGIFALYVEELSILHNELYDLPYSAISVGWGWDGHTSSTVMKNNVVEGNHIHHYMYKLRDGGGVYTLGRQPGSMISRNLIHDQIHVYGGIYLDAGSSYISVQENITYKVPMNIHGMYQDPTNPIGNNYFGLEPCDEGYPADIAALAGLEPVYRDLLVGLPEPQARHEEEQGGQEPERTDSVVLLNGKPGYTETGEWTGSDITGYDGISPTRFSVSAGASAEWRPNLNPGWYRVSFFTMVFSNSDPNAKVEVFASGGTGTAYVNQTAGEMRWVDLGIHYFDEGTGGYVKLTRMTSPSDNSYGYARANAVRFEKLE
ncbi:MAG: hypothetical protein K0R57_3545 [Paenibacillaceae bacterium]|jgi:hypothetical protein|nr:hypothetical protein [Paenibacillaceae bacterium]